MAWHDNLHLNGYKNTYNVILPSAEVFQMTDKADHQHREGVAIRNSGSFVSGVRGK